MNLPELIPFHRHVEYYLDEYGDPRVRHWLLLQNSPVYVILLSLIYIGVVHFGPKLMEKRGPVNMRGFMLFYNISLVVLSAYMAYEIVMGSYEAGYGIICAPYNNKINWKSPSEDRVVNALWLFFFSKAIEFIDTFLMVLRKKNDQLTFLHVFHHVTMLCIWWYVMMFLPGGQSAFSSSINCCVHVLMYSYYALALFPKLRPYLWWKRYLTRIQLGQFFIILAHTLHTYTGNCPFPIHGVVVLSVYMIMMITLFGNFYVQAYVKGRRSPVRNGSANQGHPIQNGSATANGRKSKHH